MTEQTPQSQPELHVSKTDLHPELAEALNGHRLTVKPAWDDIVFRKNRISYSTSLAQTARYVILPAPYHMLVAVGAAIKTFVGSLSLLPIGLLGVAMSVFIPFGRALKLLALIIAGASGYVDLTPSKANIAGAVNDRLSKHPRYQELKEQGYKVSVEPSEIPDELIQSLDDAFHETEEG